jgi:hypothetical protein
LFKVDFDPTFVKAPPNSELAYRGKEEECPLVDPIPNDDIPIFRNLTTVATNRPAYFINLRSELKTLAVFPGDCWIDIKIGKQSAKSTLKDALRFVPACFAAGGDVGKGRVLVLSDHSVFINEMMIQTDNDNFDFAYNCIDWLQRSGSDGKQTRTQVLFLDEGEIVTNFDVPVTDVPLPSMEIINRMLVKMGQENLFNRMILGPNDKNFGDILRVIIVALTTALAGFGCYRFLQARHGIEPKEPLFSAKAAQATPDAVLTMQRHMAMVKADNFWEAAHHMARDWFLANAPDLLPEPAKTSARRSVLELFWVDEGWWRRRALKKKIQAVWEVAAGPPRRLSASEFAHFVTQFEEIKAAVAKGAISVVTDV